MPRDTEEELKRLESWLLDEEEEQEDAPALEAQAPAPLSSYGAGCKIYNSDRTDEDPEKISEEILAPKKDRLFGLVLIFILLCLGIMLVLLYWLLRWKGVIG